MGLLKWLQNNNPSDAVELGEDEQYWKDHGVRKRAPRGKSKRHGVCRETKGKWRKIETPNVRGDELDEALKESGFSG